MKNFKNWLVALVLISSTAMFGQATLTGTVVDDSNQPLPGASIVVKGTTNGTSTDFDGNFTLTAKSTSGSVLVSFVGYTSRKVKFNGTSNIGAVMLSPSAESLDEVVIIGSGIIDLAKDRKTPIAVSTIKATEIQNKIGTQDVTMTLVNTPSVYVSGQAGGFGDSRMSVRGFKQDNTAYLLNGQPINGMEDGKMYWSNWSGINDIASAIQIQRGLGSSKLAISSVGGTVNFVTKTTEKREGGYYYVGGANDNYIKNTMLYSTGKNEKGFGATVMLSHWQGDGYNDGTKGQGQTYFLSFGYTPNEKHNFNFLITGAPQWHDQNFTTNIGTYLEKGKKYNANWGTYNGEYMTERRNFYHKPVANINWDFNINETTKLSSVLYASWGRGGGTGGRGKKIKTDSGNIDYDAIYAFNNGVENGTGGNYTAGGGYVTRASMNLHSWYGIVTNLEKELSENLKLNVGLDLRTYYGEHFRVVENFHGLTSWEENIDLKDQNNNHALYGDKYAGTYKHVVTTRDMAANPWTAMFANFDEDEKIAYSNSERITYGGMFTQLEYSKDKFSGFFQGAVSNQAHQRFDYYQYADQALIDGTSNQGTGVAIPAGITDGVDSKKINNVGYNFKAGSAYEINDNNKVYVNAGYYSRQPYHDNIYLNHTNQVNPLTQNETIIGFEAGYSFRSAFLTANLNLYRTNWKDRVVSSSRLVNDVIQYKSNEGVEQLHSGVELDFVSRPMEGFRFKGFVSVGDWEYKGTSITRVTDEDQNVISVEEEDIDGGKVGDAAQFSAGLGFDYRISDALSIDSDYRFYDKLHADVGAIKNNLELPSYGLVDAGLTYTLRVGKDKTNKVQFRVNINNVLDTEYLSELRTAIEAAPGDDTYKGVNTQNEGYFGYGRTWNASLRFRF